MKPRLKEVTFREGNFYFNNKVIDIEVLGLAGVVGEGYNLPGKLPKRELRTAVSQVSKAFPNARYYVVSQPENSEVATGLAWEHGEERAYGVLFLAERNKQEARK